MWLSGLEVGPLNEKRTRSIIFKTSPYPPVKKVSYLMLPCSHMEGIVMAIQFRIRLNACILFRSQLPTASILVTVVHKDKCRYSLANSNDSPGRHYQYPKQELALIEFNLLLYCLSRKRDESVQPVS